MTGLFASKEEKQQRKELEQKVSNLLKKFELGDMQKLCQNTLGKEPEPWKKKGEEYEVKGGTIQDYYPPDRRDYEDFIWDHVKKNKLTYDQIQDYAIRHGLAPKSFFKDETISSSSRFIDPNPMLPKTEYMSRDVPENRVVYHSSIGTQSEFEELMNSISNATYEKITNEEHLQSQITMLLRTKFPDKKTEREIPTSHGDKIDILVDRTYAFEVKVPQNRTELRNLSAQIDEYKEEYPMICAVIFDNQELNLSQQIDDYAEKYREKLGIPTVILRGKKRG